MLVGHDFLCSALGRLPRSRMVSGSRASSDDFYEVWTRSAAYAHHEGDAEAWNMPSCASLPAASSRSLPSKHAAAHGARGSVNSHAAPSAPLEARTEAWAQPSSLTSLPPASCRHLPQAAFARGASPPAYGQPEASLNPYEEAEEWSLSSIIKKVRCSMPVTASTACRSEDETSCPSVEQAAAVPLRTEDYVSGRHEREVVPFMLPSALRVAEYPHWHREVVPAADGELGRRSAELQAWTRSTDSAGLVGAALEPVPRRELSPSALAQLEVSLRHALRSASAMQGTAVPTEGHDGGRGRLRPSTMRYP